MTTQALSVQQHCPKNIIRCRARDFTMEWVHIDGFHNFPYCAQPGGLGTDVFRWGPRQIFRGLGDFEILKKCDMSVHFLTFACKLQYLTSKSSVHAQTHKVKKRTFNGG